MAKKTAPCVDCGVTITRTAKSDRRHICIDCACKAIEAQHRRLQDPTSEDWARSKAGGDKFAEQYRTRRGVGYEKYRKGLLNYLRTSFDTSDADGDTIPQDD